MLTGLKAAELAEAEFGRAEGDLEGAEWAMLGGEESGAEGAEG